MSKYVWCGYVLSDVSPIIGKRNHLRYPMHMIMCVSLITIFCDSPTHEIYLLMIEFNFFWINFLALFFQLPENNTYMFKIRHELDESSMLWKCKLVVSIIKQFSMRRWNSAGASNSTLTHLYKPHGVMNTISCWLSPSK